MMGPKCEREGIGQDVLTRTDIRQTSDTTPFALPFIGGVVLAVPCRVPQNYMLHNLHLLFLGLFGLRPLPLVGFLPPFILYISTASSFL